MPEEPFLDALPGGSPDTDDREGWPGSRYSGYELPLAVDEASGKALDDDWGITVDGGRGPELDGC